MRSFGLETLRVGLIPQTCTSQGEHEIALLPLHPYCRHFIQPADALLRWIIVWT
jgi:hypothetical protein